MVLLEQSQLTNGICVRWKHWLVGLLLSMLLSNAAFAQASCANPGLFSICKTLDDGTCLGCCNTLTSQCWREEIDRKTWFDAGAPVCGMEFISIAAWKQCVQSFLLASTVCSFNWVDTGIDGIQFMNRDWTVRKHKFRLDYVDGTPANPCSVNGSTNTYVFQRRQYYCESGTLLGPGAFNTADGMSYCSRPKAGTVRISVCKAVLGCVVFEGGTDLLGKKRRA
jgi:hypothetical protein